MSHVPAMPGTDPRVEVPDDLYERIGGRDTLERLTEAFYARVERDPLLRPLFRKDLKHSRDRLTLFLVERLGGPADYTKHGCSASMQPDNLQKVHAYHRIGSAEAHAWLGYMAEAIDEVGIAEPERSALFRYFVEEAQTLESPLCRYKSCSLEDLDRHLTADPSIVRLRDWLEWTLLNHAAAGWDVERVRLLISHGAKADGDGDPSLYLAANRYVSAGERRSAAGKAVAELLVGAGGDVNARSGSGAETPLHMAARRGNVAVVEALLAAGADIDAPDRKGDTPLRRAVNCGHGELAALLLDRGADPHRPDKHGATPLDAARQSRKGALIAAFGG